VLNGVADGIRGDFLRRIGLGDLLFVEHAGFGANVGEGDDRAFGAGPRLLRDRGGCQTAGGLKRIELAREGNEYTARRLMAPTANRQYVSPLPSSDERACTNATGG
jgi:hypothetical protein